MHKMYPDRGRKLSDGDGENKLFILHGLRISLKYNCLKIEVIAMCELTPVENLKDERTHIAITSIFRQLHFRYT